MAVNYFGICFITLAQGCFTNTNYDGADLRSLTADSAAGCHYNCKVDIDCAGFIFSTSVSANPNCLLKLEMLNPRTDVGFVSGSRKCGVKGKFELKSCLRSE